MLFSTIEDVYNSRFVDTAVGTSLYNLGKAIGLRLLPEQKASGYLTIKGTPGTIVPAGWLAATVAGYQFVVVAAGEIGSDGTVTLPAQATVAGADGNVEKETITTIVNPGIPEGITGVSNPAAFEGGRAVRRTRSTETATTNRLTTQAASTPTPSGARFSKM